MWINKNKVKNQEQKEKKHYFFKNLKKHNFIF